MEPKMCSVTTEHFISFSASPICFGSAAQFSRKEKKKKNRLLSQTKLGLNSRLILKNPIRLVLSYACYRQWSTSQWSRYVTCIVSMHVTDFILQLEKLRHRPIYKNQKQKRAQEFTK